MLAIAWSRASLAAKNQLTLKDRPAKSPGANRPHCRLGLLPLIVALCCGGFGATLHAQSFEAVRDRVNQGAVGLMCGRSTGSFLYFCEDLAVLLNDNAGYTMRVLPIVGEGSVRNVEDVLYLRGVDLGLAFADVLDFMERERVHPGIKDKVRYITSMFSSDLHLLARGDIRSVAELAGLKVNFSTPGTGSFLTMTNVFEALGIDVDVHSDAEAIALERLKRGEIDAMGFVAAPPWKVLQSVTPQDGLHLLEVPPELVTGPYEPTSWTSELYPQVIAPGETVRSIRVRVVLLAYNWPEDSPRCTKVQRFVDAFRAGFPKLMQEPYQEKWHEVDLDAEVKGLVRWNKNC